MSIALKPMTLEDYLNYDDGTDTRYELVNGELIAMPPESNLIPQPPRRHPSKRRTIGKNRESFC
jgi:hypothetical protein